METLPLPLQCYDDIEFSKGPIYQTDMLIDRYHVNFLVLQLVAADLLETGVDLSRGRDRDGDGDGNDNSADEVFVKIAYERDHDTTRSVDIDTNWNEL